MVFHHEIPPRWDCLSHPLAIRVLPCYSTNTMRIVLNIFLLFGFCFKSPGIVYKNKAHNPGGKKVQSFHIPSGAYKKAQYAVLDNYEDYPWGVCFPKGKHNFKRKHLNWTSTAMKKWNTQYHAFVQSYEYDTLVANPVDFPFPESHLYHRVDHRSYFVGGWPDPNGKLMIWSCDKKKYNLVYPVFGPTRDNVLAYYRSKNPVEKRYMKFWGLPYHVSGDFYGQIVMSDRHKWEKHHFINVMMHELGHLLGLPHLDPEETNIMAQWGFGCKDRGY